MFFRKYLKPIPREINKMAKLPIDFFKSGTTLVLLALSGIYLLCEDEVAHGGVGVEFYYAPMLDYILTTFIIFWTGMLLLDLADKELRSKSKQ